MDNAIVTATDENFEEKVVKSDLRLPKMRALIPKA